MVASLVTCNSRGSHRTPRDESCAVIGPAKETQVPQLMMGKIGCERRHSMFQPTLIRGGADGFRPIPSTA